MPSTKKLTVYRSHHFAGARRKKPPVRKLNRAIKDRIQREHDLLQALVRDADVRRALLVGRHGVAPPFAVWNDFDHPQDATELSTADLPRWKDVGQFLKFHLLFQIALDDGGFSFTVRVRPDLEAKWKHEGRDPFERISKTVSEALTEQGLGGLEYCFILESRTRRGSRSNLHLHGFMLGRDPMVMTRFAVAMGKAIAVHRHGRAAAGIAAKSGREILIEPCYDVVDSSKHGRGRWAGYIAKNATLYDQRFRRRVFMSRTATQTTREFWALLREE